MLHERFGNEGAPSAPSSASGGQLCQRHWQFISHSIQNCLDFQGHLLPLCIDERGRCSQKGVNCTLYMQHNPIYNISICLVPELEIHSLPTDTSSLPLRPRQNRCCFRDDFFKWIFLNENIWISIKISLKFVPNSAINNTPSLVHLMAWCRTGNKPLFEPMMASLPMHICVTWPQWVKSSCPSDNIWHQIFVNIGSGNGLVQAIIWSNIDPDLSTNVRCKPLSDQTLIQIYQPMSVWSSNNHLRAISWVPQPAAIDKINFKLLT